MTRGAKMLMLARDPDEKRRMDEPRDNYRRYDQDGTRTDYGGIRYDYDEPRGNYPDMTYGDTEARFRDRRGREHYDNGRYAPKSMEEYEEEPGSRRYRRDDAGRFRNEYPYTPIVPPVYRGDAMKRIGFAAEPRREMDHDYRTDANYPRMDEMGHRTSDMTMGHAKGTGIMLTEEMAEEWMNNLHNEDGTTGPHWTKDQTSQVMRQKGIDSAPLEFWVAMNAMYSDYCGVAKKMNVNNIDFYAHMAKAFIFDKDSQPNRLARYYTYVAKH